jgi:hypothetical protein
VEKPLLGGNVTGKQFTELKEALAAGITAVYLAALLISSQLSGFDSWQSIMLEAMIGWGLLAAMIRNARK